MKKLKIVRLAFIGTLFGTLAGCRFNPIDNQNGNIYGPPPQDDPQEEQPEPFDPSQNENQDVYGPPDIYLEEENDE